MGPQKVCLSCDLKLSRSMQHLNTLAGGGEGRGTGVPSPSPSTSPAAAFCSPRTGTPDRGKSDLS